MVEVTILAAESRKVGPKSFSRSLRRGGRVPGIVYGGGESPEPVSLDATTLRGEIMRGGFANRLFDLKTDDNVQRVLPRELQLHPVTDQPTHVDFLRLSSDSQVRLSVPVLFENEEESPGIKRGGLVNVVRYEIELICRADSIPEKLVASLAGLEIGDSVHISNIKLPDNVELTIKDRDFTVATIASPTIIVEDEVSEDIEEETVEGEEAEKDTSSPQGEKKEESVSG